MPDKPKQTLFGTDLAGNPINPKPKGAVAGRFTFSPFSVFDTRKGDWQRRKRQWINLGIQSECGRSAKALGAIHDWAGEISENGKTRAPGDGTSIFDPVLTELCYQWWCPPGGQIVDPFAGGSVRGIVAGSLEYGYWGCDLRAEQIEANEVQAEDIQPKVRPTWVAGDSRLTVPHAPEADFIFSCPPYGDLEVYSDDPADISGMTYQDFLNAYRYIIHASLGRLKNNRFACFVVSDFRDKKTGAYRTFVADTINAFQDGGALYYNEAILINAVGSACLRVSKQFNAGRKLAKLHQNVLVFCKGDWRTAAKAVTGG